MDKVEVGIMERDGREGVSHFRWTEMKQYQIIIINQYQIQKCKLFAGTEKFITAIFCRHWLQERAEAVEDERRSRESLALAKEELERFQV